MTFTFADLFAGIGGFHAAMSSFSGECVFASEIDADAALLYEHNWNVKPAGDIIPLTEGDTVMVPAHDVLCAGFPCQPFSKSGKQLGIEETRGTLFFNILKVIEFVRPSVVMLENVRNLIGPKHRETFAVIIRSLRSLGYVVEDEPIVFSPHLLTPTHGGAPQIRDRVFIVAIREDLNPTIPKVAYEFDADWIGEPWGSLEIESFLEDESEATLAYAVSDANLKILNCWDDFVKRVVANRGRKLDGFPVWVDSFKDDLTNIAHLPEWKQKFIVKNATLYSENKVVIDQWLDDWDHLEWMPPSRKKLEWQAGEQASIWDCCVQLRPSGVRVKRLNWLPALVSINHAPIIGPRKRVMTPREAARLQGFADSFDFNGQRDSLSYKQLGNAVNVGAVRHVFGEVLRANPTLNIDMLVAGGESPQQYMETR